MKILITMLLCMAIAVPVLAGPPANGTYTSSDIGGTMLPGRYSETWYPTKLSVNNTLNEQSWDGSTLGGQWWWYCPWVSAPPTLLYNGVNGAGNGQKIWRVSYTGGYCFLDGTGPWAGGDPSYSANVTTWVAIITEQYSNFVEVGTIRDHAVQGTLNGYNSDCMTIHISNVEKISDTNHVPVVPGGYPHFWNWNGCYETGTLGPGEWGDVDSITLTVTDCQSVATEPTTWGAVKAKYKN